MLEILELQLLLDSINILVVLHLNMIHCNDYFTFLGNGFNVDEYVQRSYKFAYSDCIEVGPVACLPEPPDPNELYMRKCSRQVLFNFCQITR